MSKNRQKSTVFHKLTKMVKNGIQKMKVCKK